MEGYFDKLSNKENPRSVFENRVHSVGLTLVISRRGVTSGVIENDERM